MLPETKPPPTGPLGGYGVGMPAGVNPDGVNAGYGASGGGPGPKDNSATLALSLGAGSVALSFCCAPFGFMLGIAAVAFGVMALSRKATGSERTQATVGIVLGVLGPLIYVGILVATFVFSR